MAKRKTKTDRNAIILKRAGYLGGNDCLKIQEHIRGRANDYFYANDYSLMIYFICCGKQDAYVGLVRDVSNRSTLFGGRVLCARTNKREVEDILYQEAVFESKRQVEVRDNDEQRDLHQRNYVFENRVTKRKARGLRAHRLTRPSELADEKVPF